jgi:hypothetical protein
MNWNSIRLREASIKAKLRVGKELGYISEAEMERLYKKLEAMSGSKVYKTG